MYVFVSHPLNTEWYAFQKLYNRPLKIGSFMPIKFPTSALLIMNHGVHSGWKSWNSWKNWKMGLFSEFGGKAVKPYGFLLLWLEKLEFRFLGLLTVFTHLF